MEENVQYFAVVYCTEEYKNSVHLLPCESKEACLEKLRKMREDPETRKRMKATTVIKRDMSNFKEGMIFGCPKSLDVLRSK